MPNAILRAAGANCANDISSTRWPWGYLAETDRFVVKHTGWEVGGGGSESPTGTTTFGPSSSESETLTSSSFSKRRSTRTNQAAVVSVSLRFTYQAFKDFDITIEYSGSVDSGSQSNIVIDGGDSSTSGSFSKTETRTLPRAVKPASVSVSIAAQAYEYPYADYPDVNPIDKSVSAGITITLN